MFEASLATFDPEQQAALSQKIHKRAVDNAYWVWVCHDLNPRAVSPEVKSFVPAQSWF